MPTAASAGTGVYTEVQKGSQKHLLFSDMLGFLTADVPVLAATLRAISRNKYPWFSGHAYHYTAVWRCIGELIY
jgi:hypothetical protein